MIVLALCTIFEVLKEELSYFKFKLSLPVTKINIWFCISIKLMSPKNEREQQTKYNTLAMLFVIAVREGYTTHPMLG
jgi:hypothetical protein